MAFFIAVALALSIGWGIRGNFGHEYGAMIPGALAAMAGALLAGRKDWEMRAPIFGFLGAVGWSFGGSISYMQVISYTHSGHSASVLYGFACLFVIGFLWGAPGGTGTAMAACFSWERLKKIFPAMIAVFVAWTIQDVIVGWLAFDDSAFRHENPLYWFDTDWVAALSAIVAVVVYALARRRWDEGCSLIFHMSVGWWIGFLLLVNILGLRMTPPRGDSWSGMAGLVGGLLLWLWRRGDRAVLWATLCAGFWGGFGFAFATLLKLIEVKSGWVTNWHSVLEQTYGLINGVGSAVVLWSLRGKTSVQDASNGGWLKFSIIFVLLVITYVNFEKSIGTWVKAKAVPAALYSVPTELWFAASYLLLLAVVLWIFKSKPAFIPSSGLGRGQLLFLVFLWWTVIGNFLRAVTSFSEQRLITEGVIFLNAAILSCLILRPLPSLAISVQKFAIARALAIGLVAFLVTTLGSWGVVRAIYGDTFAGHGNLHTRFGPNGPAAGPKPGQAHP